MIDIVKNDLIAFVEHTLDETIVREVKEIIMEIHSNRGETFTYKFDSKEEAVGFLTDFENDFDESPFVSIYQHSK